MILGVIILLDSDDLIKEYERNVYKESIYQSHMFADELCVTNKDVVFEDFHTKDVFHGSLLFNLNTNEVLMSQNANARLFPASTTKILTTYVALKYGELSDTITVSDSIRKVPSDSSLAYLEVGDQLTLEDALYALMLPSGNDSAVAIAEHISGSTEAFVELMNKEALRLGATNTHFTNPHGYHDKEHYTTAYDLYLFFNEALKDEQFIDIISAKSWSTNVLTKNGSYRSMTWNQSNQFVNGQRSVPKGITMIGGKTGTTFDAGACIVLYEKNTNGVPYISIIMGASSRRNLYDNMTFLLAAIPD